ncbi:proteasome activator complex subunit 4-like [Saccoglossus kowalevskii]
MDVRETELGFCPQKEIPYNKLLPYSDKLDDESNRFLSEVKANLGIAVQLRELRPGVLHWATRLSTYIRLYGRKFSKEDHLVFVKLMYELLTIPDLEFRLIQKFAHTLVTLLKKKALLSRDDLILPWRPLYKVVERVYYSHYEPLGLEWLPPTIDNVLKNLIKCARLYFPLESTQEMLDEWRPLLCPFDVTMSKGVGYMEMFLPTTLPPEHHDKGFRLWLDEMLNLWDATHSSPSWEVSVVELFARVANDNIGYIDWTPYIPKIFTRMLRCFNLPVGTKKLQVGRACNSYHIPTMCTLIIAMLGPDGVCEDHLTRFILALESYYHPSNMGKYTIKLQGLLYKLPATFVRRIHRERYKKPSWIHTIPDSHKLSDKAITTFVNSIIPAVFPAIFSKIGHMEAATALQHIALLRPELVIPPLLEKTYTALQTLTEPHQLIATLSCIVAVSRTLLKGGKWVPDGPTHLMPLLQLTLPGIDTNDIRKCMVTFQVISTFVSLVPLVDCSSALYLRDDLTEIEREVCSSTAGFEEFILVFMDRCFSLIENSNPDPATRHHVDGSKNQHESVMEVAIASTFSSIFTQSSPQLYEVCSFIICICRFKGFLAKLLVVVFSVSFCLCPLKLGLTLHCFAAKQQIYFVTVSESGFLVTRIDAVLWGFEQDWAKPGDINNLGMQWNEPTVASKSFARHLLKTFLDPEMDKLRKFILGESIHRDELKQSLYIVFVCIIGSGAMLPFWQGEPLDSQIVESQVNLTTFPNLINNLDEEERQNKRREEVSNLMHDLLQYVLTHCEDDTKSLFLIIKIYSALLTYNGAVKEEFDTRWKSFTLVKKAMEDTLHQKKQHIRALLIDRVQLQHEMRILERSIAPYTELDRKLMKDLLRLSTSMYSEVRSRAQNVLFMGMRFYAYCRRDLLPGILDNLRNEPGISHQQFKGALFVLSGQRDWSLTIVHDFKIISQIWPAVIEAGHSEKPSIMKKIEEMVKKINRQYETVVIESQVTDSCIDCASMLWKSSNPKPALPAPSIAELETSVKMLERKNSEQRDLYHKLVDTLVKLIDSGDLRWKFSQIGIGLLLLLIRSDIPIPPNAVACFVNCLVHDSIIMRKTAINGLGAILKQQKRKHKMVEVDPYKQANLPDNHPSRNEIHQGDRLDNAWNHYDTKNIPKTKEQWEKCVMIEKTHWGYYTWPKPMYMYAPPSEQPKLGRSRDELSQGEQMIYDCFINQDFVDKFIGYLSLEEKKGKDRFNNRKFILFKGLFRNFDDTFLERFKPHMQRLAVDSQESGQRCLSELTAGLIRGSKHWPFEKLDKLWEFLVPVMKTALTNLSVETVNDWATSIATSCESRDPRKLHWLFELLFEKQLCGDVGSFNDSSLLFILQGGLAQQEWRVDDLLHRLLSCVEPHLMHSYKNVRDRIGSTLVNVFLYDYPVKNGTHTKSPRRKPFIDKVVPRLSLLCDIDLQHLDVENEEWKNAIKLCKTVMKWVTGSLSRMFYAVPPELFQLLPVFVPMESCETDDESRQEGQVTLACMAQALLQPDVVPAALQAIKQIASSSSWHSRVSILNYTQVMVFYNMFIMTSNKDFTTEIQNIVVQLLTDDQLEVREMAGTTLSGFLHCGFMKMNDDLQSHFEGLCKTKLPRKAGVGMEALIQRHAGVLGLSACIQAYPYDVPQWMPQVLMDLGNHLHDPQPIEMTVKKTLSDFKRTHHDNWQEHKQQFTDDQLVVLTDLLVSPCYYA